MGSFTWEWFPRVRNFFQKKLYLFSRAFFWDFSGKFPREFKVSLGIGFITNNLGIWVGGWVF